MFRSLSGMDEREAMLKRLAVVMLALAWLTAWAQPCPCPVARSGAQDHGCCAPGPGIRAAGPDCCVPAAAGVVASQAAPLSGSIAFPSTAGAADVLPLDLAPVSLPLRPILRI